jgi:hypothetical protein
MKKSMWILTLQLLFVALASKPGFCGFLYYRFYPAAIYTNGLDPTTLEVFTDSTDIKEVQLYWHWYDPDWQSLYDDGSHGDRIANDGVYTLHDLKAKIDNFYPFFKRHHNNYGFHIKLINTAGQESIEVAQLGFVDPEVAFPAADLGDGCAATRSAFFITDTKGEIFPGYPVTTIVCGSSVYPAAYKKLYDRFEDVFDFIILMPETTVREPDTYIERVPYCVNVRNDVLHIGQPIFNESANYFSKGRLRSVVYHSFGFGAILEHEVGHSWGMRLGSTLGLIGEDKKPEGRYGHWVAQADIDGQMSSFIQGCTLADNGDGTWRLKPQNRDYMPYSPLELYAMGLIPPSEVPAVHLLENLDTSNPEKVTAGSVKTYTMAEIMAAHGGERIPAYPKAQKDFKVAFIFVSDRVFTAGELAYNSCIAEYFASDEPGSYYMMPFETATGGKATLDAALPGMEYLTGVEPPAVAVPGDLELRQNYPNPFNPRTALSFTLGRAEHISIVIYDRLGRMVAILTSGYYPAGRHTVTWDAGSLSSGLYFARISGETGDRMIKMVLAR